MRRLIVLAVGFVVACSGGEREGVSQTPEAQPLLRVSPPPGTYETAELAVSIEAASQDYSLWAAVDAEADPTLAPSKGKVAVRLVHSGRVQLLVEDAAGNRWPFTYAYVLRTTPRAPSCQVSTGAALLNGSQAAAITVHYEVTNEVDRLFVAVDGAEREVSRDELDAAGDLTLTAGPWPATGVHGFVCRIAGDQPFSQQSEIVVDADPPSAYWTGDAGAFTRAAWPFAVSLWAGDALSGLTDVQLCSARACVAATGLGYGYFDYATAFTEGTQFQGEITAVARDAVGNQAVLAPLTFDVAFAEPPRLALAPIAATYATVISLYDYVPVPMGGVADLRRVDAFTIAVSPGAITLSPGWNDFLFRQTGKTEWESFAVYHLGWHAALQPGAGSWRAFASSSTVPAFNGTLRASTSGAEFAADVWDIPHLYFVDDADGDGAWGAGETVCVPSSDSFASRWFLRALPWNWTSAPEECVAASSSAPVTTTQAWCADCAPGGRLWIEARTDWHTLPAFRAPRPDVLASALAAGMPVTAPAAGQGICFVYWDENADGSVTGDEPRAVAACGGAGYLLSRRGGVLHAGQNGNRLNIGGMRHGAGAWVSLEVTSAAGAPIRRSLGYVPDDNGLGSGAIDLPDDVVRDWPWQAQVTDGEASAALALALTPPATPAATLRIWVVDHLAQPVSEPAVFSVSTAGEHAGGVYDGTGGARLLGVQTAGAQWSGAAYREGYLSVAAASAGTDVTLKLLPLAATGKLAGRVVDAAGQPVPGANVTWSAAPYESRTVADADGRFSLPALGTGGLWAEDARSGESASRFFIVDVGSTVDTVELQIPGVGAGAARGLLHDAGDLEVRGAAALLAAPYYFADLTAGVWVQLAGTVERQFVYPGYLPSFDDLAGQWMPAPPSIGPATVQAAVCGDRRQPTGAGGFIRIDVPCWYWSAESGLERYYLGTLEAAVAPDTRARFGRLQITVPLGMTGFLRLDDLLFDRSLRLPIDGQAATALLPAGAYQVRLSDGTPVTDTAGQPMRVEVMAGAETQYALP